MSVQPTQPGGPDQSNSPQAAQLPMDPVSNRLFHAFSDVDSDSNAQHHTLGSGNNQAAPGSHSHDGTNSAILFSGAITGSRGGNVALANLISIITQQTGITDSTTA